QLVGLPLPHFVAVERPDERQAVALVGVLDANAELLPGPLLERNGLGCRSDPDDLRRTIDRLPLDRDVPDTRRGALSRAVRDGHLHLVAVLRLTQRPRSLRARGDRLAVPFPLVGERVTGIGRAGRDAELLRGALSDADVRPRGDRGRDGGRMVRGDL